MQKHYGNKLKELIKLRKMQAGEFAKLIGKSEPTVYKYYKRPEFTTEQLRIFSKVLNVSIDYWFKDETFPNTIGGTPGFEFDPNLSETDAYKQRIKAFEDRINELNHQNEILNNKLIDSKEMILTLKEMIETQKKTILSQEELLLERNKQNKES